MKLITQLLFAIPARKAAELRILVLYSAANGYGFHLSKRDGILFQAKS